ncbi:DUF3027 domain-containing protein [Streptomyces sulphureus]|uniref:DUF3027 domain-containing protein n=1 Tax=Streptomyces sulphureus TaxID=47758 RepID=UPI0003814D8A|nr:DUF3027 domain-containing protein [Streptomyces sulphureus]
MSAATQSPKRSARSRRTPDRLCAEAVGLAKEAVEEVAGPGAVGEYVEAVADGDRVVTHFFESRQPGYRDWRWAATVARASRAKVVTVDETVMLPGPDALRAPEWVPWSERLRAGDLGPGDLLPTDADDLRLEPGFSGEEAPPPNSAVSAEAERAQEARESDELTAAEDFGDVSPVGEDLGETELRTGSPAAPAPIPTRARIAAVAEDLGMGRARVLSRYGLHTAADRWEEAYGPKSPMAQAAPAACVSCAFLVPLGGSLRQAFGVCANEFSPADGHVVSFAFGCGGHSEAAVMPKPPQPPPPVLDETRNDVLELGDAEQAVDAPAPEADAAPEESEDKPRSGGGKSSRSRQRRRR